MRSVAITRVLDEADLIEAFARHTAHFVSHHVFMDNGSTDGTLEILAALQRDGLPISALQTKAVAFDESDVLTHLYRHACATHAPDWVLCLDADEFIDDRGLPGGLCQHLQETLALHPTVDLLGVPMVNYAATSLDDPAEPIVPVRIRRRLPPSDAHKIIVRGTLATEGLRVSHGSHTAALPGRALQLWREPRVGLAHYSERNPYQYLVKLIRGWSKVLATGQAEVEAQTAYHYRAPYEILRDRPASLLRDAHFMGFKNESADLVEDPIDYRGGALTHTATGDEPMRAVRCLMGLLNGFADRHGRILDQFPDVRRATREWETEERRVL